MVRRTPIGTLTFADFLELVHDDQKADLLDGMIYVASPDNTEHNKLLFWLGTIMHQFIEERKLGHITVNKVAFRLTDETAPEPDLAFVRTERAGIIKRGYVDGPPDLVIEIVSPESIERDYNVKRLRYEEAGVEEYWIIDPDESQATFLRRGANGRLNEVMPDGTIFRSTVLPGFGLDVQWLWQRPLPATLPIVHAMLGHR